MTKEKLNKDEYMGNVARKLGVLLTERNFEIEAHNERIYGRYCMLNPFGPGKYLPENQRYRLKNELENIEELSVNELELSVRGINFLQNTGIRTVKELASFTEDELLGMPKFGKQTLEIVKSALNSYCGLSLRP